MDAVQQSYPPERQDFQKLSETVGTNIQKISQNASSMQKLVNQLTDQDVRNQYNQIQDYTQQLAKDTSAMLKIMMAMPLSSHDHRHNKLCRERLGEEFLSALNMFQATQRQASKKSADEERRIRAQNINIGDPFALSNKNHQLIEMEVSNARRQEQLQMQEEEEIRLAEERERESAQLERNIISVNELFKDFAAIVHESGETVDSIEANIEHAYDSVEAGTEQLQQASNYQTKLRKKKLFFAMVLVLIIAIILVLVLHN